MVIFFIGGAKSANSDPLKTFASMLKWKRMVKL